MDSQLETPPEGPRRSTRKTSKPVAVVSEPKVNTGRKKRVAEEEEKTTTGKRVKADSVASGDDKAAGESDTVLQLSRIDIGDSLPSLILKNEKDEDVDVANLTLESGLVLFLVPKANTPGCTTQACGFRDIFPDFTSSGFGVYCLSADEPGAQSKWQTAKELPYPLLSDTKRVLISALGAARGGKTQRSHFVFEKGGRLLDKKIPVKPADSPKLALEFIMGLNKG